MAGTLLINISQNERERAIYRSRRKYQTDLATAEGRDNAMGLAEGVEKGRIEDIRNLMESMGLPLEQVMQMLKIPEQERASYRQLLQDNGNPAVRIW